MNYFASLDWRRAATIVTALLIAFLSGHLMQAIYSDDQPVAAIEQAPDAAPVLESGEVPSPFPTPPAATLMPILMKPPILPDRVRVPEQAKDSVIAGDGNRCAPTLSVRAGPSAIIDVVLAAPCQAGVPATVRQGLVTISSRTNDNGELRMRMPALTREAKVQVEVDGVTLVGHAEVDEAEEFQHVILLWQGEQVFRMHAYEFGARKSQFGHVWAGDPKTPARAARGSGGFLMRLGDGSGQSAEIYSFPNGHTPLRGVVRLEVEVEVTSGNCGHKAQARALQPGPLGHLNETEVEVLVPDCDAVGETLLLQNLLQDMRLAGR